MPVSITNLLNLCRTICNNKMSILNEKINYKALEEELHQAIKDDELYQLQNNAKFRAIEQKVPTYKDFQEMVNNFNLLNDKLIILLKNI